MVTTAGRPSGMAATARLTEMRNISWGSSPRRRPLAKTSPQMRSAADGQPLAQLAEALLERCGLVLALLQQLGDAADGRAHAGGNDDAAGATGGHGGAAEGHVELVRRGRRVDVRQGGGDLGDRLRLARQGRLVDTQRRRLDEAQVGRHDVALLEEHDVAGDDLACWDETGLPVADDTGLGARHPLEGVHGLLGPVLLDEAHGAVEDDDGQDDDGVLGVTEQRRDDGRRQQDEDHRARELIEQEPPGGPLALLDELVGAVLRAPLLDLGRAQATGRVHPELGSHGRGVTAPGLEGWTRQRGRVHVGIIAGRALGHAAAGGAAASSPAIRRLGREDLLAARADVDGLAGRQLEPLRLRRAGPGPRARTPSLRTSSTRTSKPR